jgi:hypothetical protein
MGSSPASSGDARFRGVSTDGGPCLSPGTCAARAWLGPRLLLSGGWCQKSGAATI